MLKGKRSLQVISGALAASGAGAALASANPPQNVQKKWGVDNAGDTKDSKVEKFLKGTAVALIAVTGVGLIILTVWAFVHKYVAINDLNNFLLSYTTCERNQELCARRIEDREKGIERLEEEIKNASVIEENGIKVDPSAITYDELEEILRNFGEYSEETRTRINSIKKEIQEIKENFLKLLEKNKEALKTVERGFDLDEFKKSEDVKKKNILELFEESKLYKENSEGFNINDEKYIKSFAKGYFFSFQKGHPNFSEQTNKEGFCEAYVDYLMGKNGNILKMMSKKENFASSIKNEKDRFKKIMNHLKIWDDTILSAFNKAKHAVSGLEESLKNPDFEKEREERLKTKEKLEELSSKKYKLKQSLAQLDLDKKQKTEREQYLKKYKDDYKKAKERKESLENKFWDFGKNFFKRHGNDDLFKNFNENV